MTDMPQRAEPEAEDFEETADLLPDLYVEKKTHFIYEVKFFDSFVIVRPATPSFYLAIRKLSHVDFSKEFEEFGGDQDVARAFIKGEEPAFIIED